MSKKRAVFSRDFEGLDVLDELLEVAGARVNAAEVVARFREALGKGEPAQAVVPALFDEEPRFADPEHARLLYQNLLGLWDALEAGEPLETVKKERPRREKKKKPEPPPQFDAEGPSSEWIAGTLGYLQDAGDRELERLNHAFENRQDALLQLLEEQELSEEAWATARELLFELFAFLELGWAGGVRSVSEVDLDAADRATIDVPMSLSGYADEVLGEAETDDEAPLPAEESARLRTLVRRALRALWAARGQ